MTHPQPAPPPPPTASDVGTTQGDSVQHELDELRSQLQPLSALRVTDPDHAGLEVDATPPPGQPTTDTHRMTFVVPTPDETVLSLGMAAPTRIKDTGITGRTKTHVHFHTTEEPKTMVLLGNKTNEGWAGYKANQLGLATGYMMVTEGASWAESKEQMYLVSRLADVVIRSPTKNVLVQADAKSVEVFSGESITLGTKKAVSIFGHSGAEHDDPAYKGELNEHIKKSFAKSWTQWSTAAFDNLQTVYGIMSSLWSKVIKEPIWHEPGWKPKAAKEVLSMAADIGKMILTGQSVYHELSGEEEPEPNVNIVAEKDVGIVAGKGLELHGKLGAGLSSVITCDIIGGTTAMKAATFGGVWAGIIASLKAGLDVSIGAEHGETEITAKKDVAIAAGKGVSIQGEENVQLVGKEGKASVFGEKAVYVAANGYGMKAVEDSLFIGKLTSPKKFASAAAASTSTLKFTDSSVTMLAKGAGILLDGDSCKFYSKGDACVFKLSDSGTAEANGSKILLG